MWLVCNGIENIILLPQLENDGFRVTYNTLKAWVVICPDGNPILFKHNTSLCDWWPYVYLEYLNTIKCKAVNMVQTVRGNFDGFTKIYVEKANIASKVQTILGSPYENNTSEWWEIVMVLWTALCHELISLMHV